VERALKDRGQGRRVGSFGPREPPCA